MANLLFNYVLSLLYFNVNPALLNLAQVCTAYQKSFRKTKVRFFRIQEYYYILQLSYKGKGVSVEENLMYIILNIHTAKFEIITQLLSIRVKMLFKLGFILPSRKECKQILSLAKSSHPRLARWLCENYSLAQPKNVG